ncbi:MAG: prolyl oligopeptidase family serine peptidase [Bradymonadales bacterium]|jgi:prolyl oligopeptidase
MKRKIVFVLFAAVLGCSAAPPQESAIQKTNDTEDLALRLEKIDNKAGDTVDEWWGEQVADPYRWLEDASDPDVQSWVEAQDARARGYLSKIKTRDYFADLLEQLMYIESIGAPYARAGAYFYAKRGAHDEKAKYFRQKDGVETLILDPHDLSEDGSVSIGGISLSPNGRYLAYKRNVNNADTASLHIRDLETGEDLQDVIMGGRYADPAWLPDSQGFYYTDFPTDEAIAVDLRPGLTTVRFHAIGSDPAQDPIIKAALNDATKFHGVDISEDGRWLSYTIRDGWNGSLVFMKYRDASDDTWIALPNKKNTHYYTQMLGDELFVLTNDSAPKYRLLKLRLDPEAKSFAEKDFAQVIAEDSDAVIDDYLVVNNKIFVLTIENVSHRLKRYDMDGKFLGEIALPDEGSIGVLRARSTDNELFVSFQSPKIAPQILKIDVNSGSYEVWAQTRSQVQSDDIINEQKWAVSKDGTKIPMRILRKKSFSLDGTAPTIVYGYGGFNVSITPSYRPAVFAWLERGGIYVYANLRGGGEFGEAWHQAGMGKNKQNVFDDYYAVAEYLIAENYSASKHMAAYGGSNGGLLVGAALTQRPSLFGAIVCAVPLLDMLRYHLFGSGRTWSSEYSTAETDPDSFKTIRAYSPYANVVPNTAYPPVLFLGADSDDRVDPMHARKMTAAVQDATASSAPVILRIEKNAGHGGADMTKHKIAELADVYAFCDENLR